MKSKLLSAAVMLLFCYLSFGLFELSNHSVIASSPTFSKQGNAVAIKKLNKESEQLREQYGYMVFRKERIDIEGKLIKNLQKQINLQPFDSNLWRELTFLQASGISTSKKTTAADRQWTFLVSNKLLEWNPHERMVLLKRCVYFLSDYQADVKSACYELFTYILQKENLNSLAHKLAVTKQMLQNVIVYYGVDERHLSEK